MQIIGSCDALPDRQGNILKELRLRRRALAAQWLDVAQAGIFLYGTANVTYGGDVLDTDPLFCDPADRDHLVEMAVELEPALVVVDSLSSISSIRLPRR